MRPPPAQKPHQMIDLRINRGRLVACQKCPSIRQLPVHPAQRRAKLRGQMRQGCIGGPQPLGPILPQIEPPAILGEILRQRIASGTEHNLDRQIKQRTIGPTAQRPQQPLVPRRKQRGRGIVLLQRAQDALAITIDIRADLHHRRAPVAACQNRQHRLGGQPRYLDRAPRQPFDPESYAHLLGHRGLRIIVQDNLVDRIGHMRGFLLGFPAQHTQNTPKASPVLKILHLQMPMARDSVPTYIMPKCSVDHSPPRWEETGHGPPPRQGSTVFKPSQLCALGCMRARRRSRFILI